MYGQLYTMLHISSKSNDATICYKQLKMMKIAIFQWISNLMKHLVYNWHKSPKCVIYIFITGLNRKFVENDLYYFLQDQSRFFPNFLYIICMWHIVSIFSIEFKSYSLILKKLSHFKECTNTFYTHCICIIFRYNVI